MSKRRVPSAITRVKTSSRPVELFGLAAATICLRQREAFEQRHDIDAAGLQHRAVGEIDLVQLELVDALGDGRARARQEARAHAVGDVAEPEIEARRLDLAFDKGIGRQDHAGIRHRRDHAVGQNALASFGSENDKRHDPCTSPLKPL